MIQEIVISPTMVLAFLLWNIVTYLMMAWDKFCAIAGRWRVSEGTLLGFALLGGALDAKSAQFLCRHKTRKQPFARALNVSFGLNVLALSVVIYLWLAA